jgi:hypothetical protein
MQPTNDAHHIDCAHKVCDFHNRRRLFANRQGIKSCLTTILHSRQGGMIEIRGPRVSSTRELAACSFFVDLRPGEADDD